MVPAFITNAGTAGIFPQLKEKPERQPGGVGLPFWFGRESELQNLIARFLWRASLCCFTGKPELVLLSGLPEPGLSHARFLTVAMSVPSAVDGLDVFEILRNAAR